MFTDAFDKKIKIIEKKMELLGDKRTKLINERIDSCDHPLESIKELPYTESSGKPWLICSKCGYTEEGWYCGYKKLRFAEFKNPPKITFVEWMGMRRRCVWQNGNIS